MSLDVLEVELKQPPGRRWSGLRGRERDANALLDTYLRDLGATPELVSFVAEAATATSPADYLEEVRGIAALIERPFDEVLVGNVYYDVTRHLLGCTALAVDTDEGPLHARNLDWWTEERRLADLSVRVRVSNAPAGDFELVSWPGFIGAFSGVAPGRFAITLNAVLSNEQPALAISTSFLVRRAFEEAADFAAAVELLRATPIASDCLLLVTGTRRGEMVVIERTSTRAALRWPEDGMVCVTNDYRLLEGEAVAGATSELVRTGGSRYVAATELARAAPPASADLAFTILQDPRVKMGCTVQHMVLSAARGTIDVRIPG